MEKKIVSILEAKEGGQTALARLEELGFEEPDVTTLWVICAELVTDSFENIDLDVIARVFIEKVNGFKVIRHPAPELLYWVE